MLTVAANEYVPFLSGLVIQLNRPSVIAELGDAVGPGEPTAPALRCVGRLPSPWVS